MARRRLQVLCPNRDTAPAAAGFTLIEVVIATAVMLVVLLAVGMLSGVSQAAFDQLSRAQRVDRDLKQSLMELTRDLRRASLATVAVDSSDDDWDTLTLQVPDPDDASGNTTWGYTDANGTFQPDHFAAYVVLEENLVRRVFDDSGNQVGDDLIVARHLDDVFTDADGTRKGFDVTVNGSLVQVLLRVHETFLDGTDYRREERTIVNVPNP